MPPSQCLGMLPLLLPPLLPLLLCCRVQEPKRASFARSKRAFSCEDPCPFTTSHHPPPLHDMDLVFKLAEQKEEGVEDVTVDEWRQSGVSLFGVCSLFSKRRRPPPRPLIQASKGKGAPLAPLPKADVPPASAPLLPQLSEPRSPSPSSHSLPALQQHTATIMVHPASFSSLDLLLDVNDMQVPSCAQLPAQERNQSGVTLCLAGAARERRAADIARRPPRTQVQAQVVCSAQCCCCCCCIALLLTNMTG
jgi:hypothetical protein